ncbi:HEPN domain-containing protein [Anatilimnocola floriformis]|uniref:HEPN domain-containing protein n=1 Tax=Anatilimnocola floriformis TaxID=2948575 RepID=UPI0020C3B759|nr:HEPN domain-containing protein [Anatilimnocola floriformis]
MKPEAFLAQAGKLAAHSQNDAANARTATSRAYYCAFHLVRLFLAELNFPAGKDHDLHKPLMASRNPIGIEAARYLSHLYESRRRADYELTNVGCETQEVAQNSVERAERIKSLLLQMQAEPPRTEIAAGLHTYQQQLPNRIS